MKMSKKLHQLLILLVFLEDIINGTHAFKLTTPKESRTEDLNHGSHIEPINSQTGVYFDYIGKLYFYPTEWSFINYVDLTPIKRTWRETKDRISKLKDICNNIRNETWYSYTDCQPSIPYFQSKKQINERTKNILIDLMGKDSESNRRKRDVFNFGGKLLKFLFGTATEDEVTANYEHIESMEKDHKEFLRIASEQMLVLKSTIVTMNTTLKDISGNEQKLREALEKLNSELSIKQGRLQIEFKTIIILNEFIKQIERGLEECQHTFDLLIDVYLHAQDGVIQPQIVTIQKIQEVLALQTMPDSTMFPPFSSPELLSLIKPTIYTQGSYLIYSVKVPLVSETVYNLFRVIPIPVIMSSQEMTKILNIKEEYIFANNVNEKYGQMNNEKLNKCFRPNKISYVCAELLPIINYIPDVDCVSTLLHPNTLKVPEICTFNYLPLNQVLWIPLHSSNTWLYIAPKLELFTTICQNGKKHSDRLQGRGLLTLRKDCKGLGTKSTLIPMTHFETNITKDDILPFLEIDTDCCLTLPQQEMSKNIPLNIPLSNIMSSINELNMASLKVEEVKKYIDEQQTRENERSYSWRLVSTSWYTYIITFIILIIIWICSCCCCTCCRKCSFWLLSRFSFKKWWSESKQLCTHITFHNTSVNQINVSAENIPQIQQQLERQCLTSDVIVNRPQRSSSVKSLPSAPEMMETDIDLPEPVIRRSNRLKSKEFWSIYKN